MPFAGIGEICAARVIRTLRPQGPGAIDLMLTQLTGCYIVATSQLL